MALTVIFFVGLRYNASRPSAIEQRGYPFPCLGQQAFAAVYLAELLRSTVASDFLGQALEACAVATGKKYSPGIISGERLTPSNAANPRLALRHHDTRGFVRHSNGDPGTGLRGLSFWGT